MIEMGFTEGFKMTLNNLENYWQLYRKNDPIAIGTSFKNFKKVNNLTI